MPRLDIYLPTNRWLPGFLRLYNGEGRRLLYDIPCRGKADSRRAAAKGNPDRGPTRPWGDLPSGSYRTAQVTRYDPPHPTFVDLAIILEGNGGDALKAARNGRTGLAVHGGRGNVRLTATYGCLRVFDRDMFLLAECIGGGKLEVEVIDCPSWPPDIKE